MHTKEDSYLYFFKLCNGILYHSIVLYMFIMSTLTNLVREKSVSRPGSYEIIYFCASNCRTSGLYPKSW